MPSFEALGRSPVCSTFISFTLMIFIQLHSAFARHLRRFRRHHLLLLAPAFLWLGTAAHLVQGQEPTVEDAGIEEDLPEEQANTRRGSIDFDVFDVQLTDEARERLENAELLMDDADLLSPEMEEKLLMALQAAKKDFGFSLYVHVVDAGTFRQIYPKFAAGFLRANLFTSTGGLLVLTDLPEDSLNVYSTLAEVKIGEEELRRVNALAREEAQKTTESTETRVAQHIRRLLQLLLVRVQAGDPSSVSSSESLLNPQLPGFEGAPETEATAAAADSGSRASAKSRNGNRSFLLGLVIGLLFAALFVGWLIFKNARRRRGPGDSTTPVGISPVKPLAEGAGKPLTPRFSPSAEFPAEEGKPVARYRVAQQHLKELLDEAQKELNQQQPENPRPAEPGQQQESGAQDAMTEDQAREVLNQAKGLLQDLPDRKSREKLGQAMDDLQSKLE